MTIFSEFAPHRSRLPLLNAQTFAFEQLVCIHSVTTDLRWAMVELAWRSFTAMFALRKGRLSPGPAGIVRRGSREVATGTAAADTTVAAGGR